MKYLFVGGLSFVVAGLFWGWTRIELARDGKTEHAIIQNTNATPAEQFAAKELSAFLEKATGAKFAVISETNQPLPQKAIYVGWTDFAGRHADLSKLGEEEWILKNIGKNILLTGGRPRGTLYAVYEFLEQKVGCHWLDESTEVVPSKPELKLDKFDITGKPLFWDREIQTGLRYIVGQKQRNLLNLFNVRNKSPHNETFAKLGLAQFGFSVRYGSPGENHTFYDYSKDWPTNHPEYLAMNDNGERVRSTSTNRAGQICLTNPEVRKLMLEKLRQYIIKDRAGAAKAGAPPPRIYAIEQNDYPWSCRCPECKAFSEREGSDSGPMVDLVNYLADGVRDEFPDVLIDTFAYANTLKSPKTVRPRDNVIIRLAQLTAEWAWDSKESLHRQDRLDKCQDMFKPMTNVINRWCYENLVNWSKITKHLSYWDYWILYLDKFPTPYVNISSIKANLELFLDLKVEVMFVECEDPEKTSFFALKHWLGYKLMQDPRQPLEPLIQTFMQGYYGQASAKMREYLAYMEQRIAAVPGPEKLATARPYLDLEFFVAGEHLLDEAEVLCGGDKTALLHVQRERIPVDAALWCLWEQLQSKLPAGKAMPFDRDPILRRYEANRLAQMEALRSGDTKNEDCLEAGRKELAKEIKKYQEMPLIEKRKAEEAPLIEKRKAEKPPELQVVKLKESIGGDLSKADWAQASVIEKWKSLQTGGERAERKISGRLAHDDQFLYIQLVEETDTSKLKPELWTGDNWELFFAAERGKAPYNQLAINLKGEHADYVWRDYSPANGGKAGAWESGAVVKSEADGKLWKVSLALPLDKILPGGIKPGRKLYANFYRSTPAPGEHMAWSPSFDTTFHLLSRMGGLSLE